EDEAEPAGDQPVHPAQQQTADDSLEEKPPGHVTARPVPRTAGCSKRSRCEAAPRSSSRATAPGGRETRAELICTRVVVGLPWARSRGRPPFELSVGPADARRELSRN